MLPTLIRPTLVLAAVAAGAGLLGPSAQRGLCIDSAVLLLAAAFLLWRGDAALRARRRRAAAEPAPAPRLLADARHREHVERRLAAVVALEPGSDTAEQRLQRVGDVLRAELGARGLRVCRVERVEGRTRLCERLVGPDGSRLPIAAARAPDSPAARAAESGRICTDLPQGVALPIAGPEGRPSAVIELTGFELDIDPAALEAVLALAAQTVRGEPLQRPAATPAARLAEAGA